MSNRESASSSHHYKDSYRDAKHELKRKKREIEDLEDQLKGEEQNAKKLKTENHDLWKLYYGLQQELTGAYERNAKLQMDKASLDALFDRERLDWERQRLEFIGASDESKKLKDALCNMQKDKLAMQKKFNDLVIENKMLREKEREVEPKIRELDELKRKLNEFEELLSVLQSGFAKQRNDIKEAMTRKEQVDSVNRWNDLLKQELEQKTKKIHHWDTLLRAYEGCERQMHSAESQLKAKETEIGRLHKETEKQSVRLTALHKLARELSGPLKTELRSVADELRTQNIHFVEQFSKIYKFLHKSPSSPDAQGENHNNDQSVLSTSCCIDETHSDAPTMDDVVELSDSSPLTNGFSLQTSILVDNADVVAGVVSEELVAENE